MWQALNPDKWIEESQVNEFFQEIIGLPIGTKITTETPLRPFHKDVGGTVMMPSDVRHPYDLGYTYPELQTWKYDPQAYTSEPFLKDLRKTINDLYGFSRQQLLDATSNLAGVEYLEDGTKNLDFAFSIRYRKYAFGGEPFWIRIFLSRDGVTQNAVTDLITEVYNFSQKPDDPASGKVVCTNCKDNENANLKSTAAISITPVLITLLKAGAKELPSLKKEDVLEFLKKRAYWRVFKSGKEVPRNQLDPLDLEIIGSTNDATQFKDPTKAPLLENFKKEPSISGGADGALDPTLRQPMTVPPPPMPDIPQADLKVNSSLAFKGPFGPDAVVIIDSSSLDMTPAKTSGIDNTQVFFSENKEGDGDILFLLSFRRSENQIVLNTRLNDSWGKEVRASLEDRFKGTAPSILIHDQGDGYEIFLDWRHLTWFEKREKDKVANSVSYKVNEGQTSMLSPALKIRVYASMKDVFQK